MMPASIRHLLPALVGLVFFASCGGGHVPKNMRATQEVAAKLPRIDRICRGGDVVRRSTRAISCGKIGDDYRLGRQTSGSVDVDRSIVVMYSKMACRLGRGYSCFVVGTYYLETFPDGPHGHAIKFLEKACELKSPEGCANLGRAYLNYGLNNRKRGIAMLQRSCRTNTRHYTVDPSGCALLGSYYALGLHGLPVDLRLAKHYLTIACQRKYKDACKGLRAF